MCAYERLSRLAVKSLHTSVAVCQCGWYLCYSSSRFIKGVAISTRQYVALRFVFFVSSLSPSKHSKHCGRATHDLDREDWQPCLAPGLWSAISTSKLKLDPALHHQPRKHLRNKTSSNCKYQAASLFTHVFTVFVHFYFGAGAVRNTSAEEKHSYFVWTQLCCFRKTF